MTKRRKQCIRCSGKQTIFHILSLVQYSLINIGMFKNGINQVSDTSKHVVVLIRLYLQAIRDMIHITEAKYGTVLAYKSNCVICKRFHDKFSYG